MSKIFMPWIKANKGSLKILRCTLQQTVLAPAIVQSPTMRTRPACPVLKSCLEASLTLRHRFPENCGHHKKLYVFSEVPDVLPHLWRSSVQWLWHSNTSRIHQHVLWPRNGLECVCQDVILSHTSKYWQPQFLSSILNIPNPPSSQYYVIPCHLLYFAIFLSYISVFL